MKTGGFLVPYHFAEGWSIHEWAESIGLVKKWRERSWLGHLFGADLVAQWMLPDGTAFPEAQITALFHRAHKIGGFAAPTLRYDI